MRIFKTKVFARFARREGIMDRALCEAAQRAERGLVDADLGGGVIKQRIPRAGQGRSGGYRTLLAFRSKERAIFLYGFAKSERDNIKDDELMTLQEIAASWLAADAKQIETAIAHGILQEVHYEPDAK